MIIIHCKVPYDHLTYDSCELDKTLKIINQGYIEKIEYINNSFDDIISHVKTDEVEVYRDLFKRYHNPIGPAFSKIDFNNEFAILYHYKHGNFHNIDGPAIYKIDKNKNITVTSYYIDGVWIETEPEFKKKREKYLACNRDQQ